MALQWPERRHISLCCHVEMNDKHSKSLYGQNLKKCYMSPAMPSDIALSRVLESLEVVNDGVL